VRPSLVGWVVALALACSACAVDTTVTVKVREDGSGFVRVDLLADAEAVQTAEVGGGTLEQRIRLGDLTAAGWRVEPWVRNLDGSASLSLSKPFTEVGQAEGILRELNGDAGPLRDATFTRTRSFLATELGARASADMRALRTGVLEDTELMASLQAQGVDVNALDQALLAQLRDALTIRLVVELPGGHRSVMELPADQPASLETSVSVRDTKRVTLLVFAGLLALAAVVVALWPRRRGPRRRGRPHLPRAPRSRYVRRPEPHEPLSWEAVTSPTRGRTPPGS